MQNLRWRFTPHQFDILWAEGGLGALPYPFELRSHGDTEEHRLHIRHQVAAELRSGGLLRQGELDRELEAALRLLARPALSIDSVWLADETGDSPHRVLACADGRRAIIVRQLPGESEHAGGDILLGDIAAGALVPAIITELPPELPGGYPGGQQTFTDLGAPPPASRGDEDEGYGSVLVSTNLTTTHRQRDSAKLRAIVDAVHTRTGQFGASSRDQVGRKRRSPVLRWFDNTADGRYTAMVTERAAEQWLRVSPVDAARLGTQLGECLSIVTAPPRRPSRKA
jgi:hypothetical protein